MRPPSKLDRWNGRERQLHCHVLSQPDVSRAVPLRSEGRYGVSFPRRARLSGWQASSRGHVGSSRNRCGVAGSQHAGRYQCRRRLHAINGNVLKLGNALLSTSTYMGGSVV